MRFSDDVGRIAFQVDLMWAQALGLIAVPLKNHPGFNVDGQCAIRKMIECIYVC